MAIGELVEALPNLPREWEHFRYGLIADEAEKDFAGRVSGRRNAVLGVGGQGTVRAISEATCGRGDVYVIHPSDAILNVVMDTVLTDRLTNVDFRRARLDRLPAADGAFDTVFFVLQLHHEANPVIALREAIRTLRPDGRIVILEAAGRRGDVAHTLPGSDFTEATSGPGRWLEYVGLRPVATTDFRDAFKIRRGATESSYDLVTLEARRDSAAQAR